MTVVNKALKQRMKHRPGKGALGKKRRLSDAGSARPTNKGKKVKVVSNTKGSKAKTPTQYKEVKAGDLDWKPIDVSAHLDDYEGFYELEELDGVDVEVENGVVKFKQAVDAEPAMEVDEQAVEQVEQEVEQEADAVDETQESETMEPETGDLDIETDGEQSKPNPEVKTKTKTKTKEQNEQKKEALAKKKQDKKKNNKATPKDSSSTTNAFELLEEDVDTSNLEWGATGALLCIPLQKALSKQGFTTPTEIQRQAIPVILEGRDIVGKAATGSGKTLAYGIPIIQKHVESLKSNKNKTWPTGLVLAPTRELAHQITQHLELLWRFCAFEGQTPLPPSTEQHKEERKGEDEEQEDDDLEDKSAYGPGVVSITGGLSVQKQKRLLQQRPAIIVATPGRLLDILEEGKAEIQDLIKKTEMMVLDEADRLIKEGHFKELDKILDLIGRGHVSGRQTLVISATFEMDLMNKLVAKRKLNYSSNKQGILSILDKKLEFKDKKKFQKKKNNKSEEKSPNGPVFIDANPAEAVASKVVESIMECGAMEKDLYLYYFLAAHPGRSIVFVNSIDSVKRISPMLKELGLAATGLHSDMIQKQRLRSLERFKENSQAILVSTDVAARGLDIPMVQHVIHYHLPRTADMYIHRSGRTARAGNEGVSLVICSPEEASGALVKLKTVLYKKLGTTPKAMKTLDVDYQILKRLKHRVSLAKDIADSQQEVTRRGKSSAWLEQAADDLGIDMSDDEKEALMGDKSKEQMSKKAKAAQIKSMRQELAEDLAKPVGYGGKYLTRGTVNIAQIMSSQDAHASFMGKKQTSALQALK